MLLQRLNEYQARTPDPSDDEASVPPEYGFRAVPWIIQLDKRGDKASFIRTSGGRPRNDPGKRFCVPLLRRQGTGVKPQLLADKAEFVLGLATPQGSQRAVMRHREFVALVRACGEQTQDHRVKAVARFLEQLPESAVEKPADLRPEDLVTFQVDGVRPVDLESVREFWASIAPRLGERGVPTITVELVSRWIVEPMGEELGQCMLCSEVKPIARVHPIPVRLPRAVADQQLSVVTANKDAFWSYGLEQSLLAPTCRTCSVAYGRAINCLARDEARHLVVGHLIYLFWTRDEIPFSFVEPLTGRRDCPTLHFLQHGEQPAAAVSSVSCMRWFELSARLQRRVLVWTRRSATCTLCVLGGRRWLWT
jgi:CRISPR-associated protein Csd1